MPYAIELFLDRAAESMVREVWRTLDDAGIFAPRARAEHTPHVTLAVVGDLDVADLAPAVDAFPPSHLTLSYLGAFPSTNVLYLGVTATAELLALQERVYTALARSPGRVWDYYRPGAWVPHCTLARDLAPAMLPRAFDLCREVLLPIFSAVEEMGVVDISSGVPVCSWRLDAETMSAD